MIARHRGDLRIHSRWSPSTPSAPPLASSASDAEEPRSRPSDEPFGEPLDPNLTLASKRKPGALISVATIIAVAVIAGQQHGTAAPHATALPATPQQWVDQWTAATLQSPAQVCGYLYAPALTRAFKGDTGHSCTSYYTSVQSRSFRIRHVLQDGPAVAVEAQEVGTGRRWGYFTMLLSHVHGGWQAVDVVPGAAVRAR